MLRKIGHIVVSAILLLATVGLTIDKHYCDTRLVSISILGDTETCCDMEDGCCHDESDTFLLTTDYTIANFTGEIDLVSRDIPVQPTLILLSSVSGPSFTDFIGFSPPRKPRQTLSVLQTYRL
ncbi:MAG TPA: hypothetical protein ENI20_11600 [Bacteroides sp.]|nr:hypothetical protein [Bacteroides sp.]